MSRMTGEFTLVLLGAGLLTAGSFLWPDELTDPNVPTDEEAVALADTNGTTTNHQQNHHYRSHGGFLMIYSSTTSARPSAFSSAPRPAASGGFASAAPRGGFGGSAHSSVGS